MKEMFEASNGETIRTEELDVVELHRVGEEETTNRRVDIKHDQENCDDCHEERGGDTEAQRQPAC